MRQMLDTLESAALYIIFIPHTLVCSGSACGKSDVRRSMAFVERLASVPFPISAPSVMAAGISVTGPTKGYSHHLPAGVACSNPTRWRSSVSVPSSPLTWGRVRGGPSLRKCQLKHSFLQAEQIEAAGLGQKTKGHFRLLKWPSASRQRSERLHTRKESITSMPRIQEPALCHLIAPVRPSVSPYRHSTLLRGK